LTKYKMLTCDVLYPQLLEYSVQLFRSLVVTLKYGDRRHVNKPDSKTLHLQSGLQMMSTGAFASGRGTPYHL
jgi:hypothetical protein